MFEPDSFFGLDWRQVAVLENEYQESTVAANISESLCLVYEVIA